MAAVKNTNLLIPSKAKPKNTVILPGTKDRPTTSRPPSQIAAPSAGVPSVTPSSSYQPVQPTPVAAPKAAPGRATPDIASDPIYQAAIASINHTRDDTLLQLEKERGTIKTQYGIDDTTEPFSRAKLLQESLANAVRGTTTSRAASGMFYDASSQHAQDLNQSNYSKSYDALLKAYQAAITDVENRKTNTINATSDSAANAGAEALSRLLQTRPEPGAGDDDSAASAAPTSYSGFAGRGYQTSGKYKGKYIDKDGGVHAAQTKNGKRYYLGSSGKWIPIG